jgi:hypothetical protein
MFVFCLICRKKRKRKILGHVIFYTYCKSFLKTYYFDDYDEIAEFFTKSIMNRARCVKVVVAISLRKKDNVKKLLESCLDVEE